MKYRKCLPHCSGTAIFQGRIKISDKSQIHIGERVEIGSNCTFYSEGGIYISAGSKVEKNSVVNTYDDQETFKWSTQNTKKLKPVFIGEGMNDSRMNFFVVSTGRSGSNTIADILNEQDGIACTHEKYFSMIRLSTEFAHKQKNESQVRRELDYIFKKCQSEFNPKELTGDSDQKYANLIGPLHFLFKEAKFIWLIRHPADFVASAFVRRWFDDAEFSYPFKVHSPDTADNYNFLNEYRVPYSVYRINGCLCGEMKEEIWKGMNCFERCCWYWSYWNDLIEKQLLEIDRSQWIMIKLHELNLKEKELSDFLGVPVNLESLQVKNKAKYIPLKQDLWSEDQKTVFEKWCGPGLKKWFS